MKKFLSLVLALVMTMSLVTVSAGAKDFTDNSKINYKEAVDVMSAVKVIDGYVEGDFRPANTLTRGAAAKIICNLILGPTTASALVADTAPYKDVPTTNTFAGYIAYCAKEGIISGYADGTFRPAASLSGYAFMKMLLGALGYDATTEGYIGNNWSINVAKRALNVGLDDGLKGNFNGVKAVNREEACLYALNTLKATMVEYENNNSVTVNGITFTNKSTAKEVTTGNKTGLAIGDEKTLQFAEKYFPDLKGTSDKDDFSRPATTWKNKSKEIGTYAKTPDAVYTDKVKGKEVYADLGDKFGFEKYGEDEDAAFFVDGKLTAKSTKATPTAYTDGFAVEKNNDKKIGGKGVLTEVYVIKDGVKEDVDGVRIVEINTYVATVEDDYDKDDEELDIDVKNFDGDFVKDGEVLSSDDFDGLDAFKEDDVVLVTVAYNDNGKYEVKSIEKADTTTAKVTTYESNYDDGWMDEKDSVTAGGTKYNYSAKFAALCSFNGEYEIGEDAVFYLDNYGFVIAVDEVDTDDEYVYVDSYEASGVSTKATISAYAYFTDGTAKKIELNEVDDVKAKNAVTPSTDDAGYLFTYKTKSNGKYDLTSKKWTKDSNNKNTNEAKALAEIVEDKDWTTSSDGNTKSASIEAKYVVDVMGARATKETTFVIINGDDEATVYTGIKNLPTIDLTIPANGTLEEEDTPKFAVVTDGRYAQYVFIDLANDDYADTEGADSKGSVFFLYEGDYDKKGKDSDKNVYYQYNAIVDGKETTLKFNEDFDDLENGLYTDVKVDENGYIKSCKQVTTKYTEALDNEKNYSQSLYTPARVMEKDGDVLTFVEANGSNATKGFYLADDCKVVVIDGTDVETYSLSKIEKNYNIEAVWTIMNDDQDVTTLFLKVVEK